MSYASHKLAFELTLNDRLAEMAGKTKDAVDKEWAVANAAIESNHQIELEELRDELEYTKQDLKGEKLLTKELLKKNRTKMHAMKDGYRKAIADVEISWEKKLENLEQEHKKKLEGDETAWNTKISATNDKQEKKRNEFEEKSHLKIADLETQVTTLCQQLQISEGRVKEATSWALSLGAAEEHDPFNIDWFAHVAEACQQGLKSPNPHQIPLEYESSTACMNPGTNDLAHQLQVALQIIEFLQADKEKCEDENFQYFEKILALTAALE